MSKNKIIYFNLEGNMIALVEQIEAIYQKVMETMLMIPRT